MIIVIDVFKENVFFEGDLRINFTKSHLLEPMEENLWAGVRF